MELERLRKSTGETERQRKTERKRKTKGERITDQTHSFIQ